MTDARDKPTVAGFGEEWAAYDQSQRSDADLLDTFERYTTLVDWDGLPRDARGIDLGCGSGRWSRLAVRRVGSIVAVDASPKAVAVAARAVEGLPVRCLVGSAGVLPFPDRVFDFGLSLGVLHHTTDPVAGLTDLVRVLRPSAPCLVYVYYALDDRPGWFRVLWRASDGARRLLSRTPFSIRRRVADLVALLVYLPLARLARVLERRGRSVGGFPLAAYRDKPLLVLRTDALDRLGTRVERRFTRSEVVDLLTAAGLVDVRVADPAPHWCAIGVRPES